ncbi:uncharacterized protein LOC100904205, partial [Galendromus occidentalis]|uniref:Uncharacterized protein LOC100904205 n=1 Tax=Galendromus occidentalis TaxID=34638 RepID=A0AAJ6QMA0_9ACAR
HVLGVYPVGVGGRLVLSADLRVCSPGHRSASGEIRLVTPRSTFQSENTKSRHVHTHGVSNVRLLIEHVSLQLGICSRIHKTSALQEELRVPRSQKEFELGIPESRPKIDHTGRVSWSTLACFVLVIGILICATIFVVACLQLKREGVEEVHNASATFQKFMRSRMVRNATKSLAAVSSELAAAAKDLKEERAANSVARILAHVADKIGELDDVELAKMWRQGSDLVGSLSRLSKDASATLEGVLAVLAEAPAIKHRLCGAAGTYFGLFLGDC